ncbi:hypothetical protein [Endozoicomonas lisbonensis]|uniref:Uncharacterized protein n=1 Tax=Endozoicomonas lisbonensis TaxID=3120522 RepID=A0ABV2SG60_9GAMM
MLSIKKQTVQVIALLVAILFCMAEAHSQGKGKNTKDSEKMPLLRQEMTVEEAPASYNAFRRIENPRRYRLTFTIRASDDLRDTREIPRTVIIALPGNLQPPVFNRQPQPAQLTAMTPFGMAGSFDNMGEGTSWMGASTSSGCTGTGTTLDDAVEQYRLNNLQLGISELVPTFYNYSDVPAIELRHIEDISSLLRLLRGIGSTAFRLTDQRDYLQNLAETCQHCDRYGSEGVTFVGINGCILLGACAFDAWLCQLSKVKILTKLIAGLSPFGLSCCGCWYTMNLLDGTLASRTVTISLTERLSSEDDSLESNLSPETIELLRNSLSAFHRRDQWPFIRSLDSSLSDEGQTRRTSIHVEVLAPETYTRSSDILNYLGLTNMGNEEISFSVLGRD